jgi:hypothetical protein
VLEKEIFIAISIKYKFLSLNKFLFKMLSLKQKFDSYSLCFETKELVDSLDSDSSPALETDGKKTWFKEKKPTVVDEIDKQIRKNFDIGTKNKMVFSVYYPPSDQKGTTVISDQKENVISRVLVSTINEQMQVAFKSRSSEKIEMKQWVAYQTPPLVGGMLKYTFENSNNMTMEAKKGFRSVRKVKKIGERYIMVFDYIIEKDDIGKITSLLKGSGIDQTEIENALKLL